jgi:hypothetical protein
MKIPLNKVIVTAIVSSVLVFCMVSPAFAVVDASNSVCARVATLTSTKQAAVAIRVATMQTNFSARLTKIVSDKAVIDQKIATARANASQQFNSKVQKLEAKTGLTDTQKQAIETYQTDMQQAEKTRELAIDTARQTYRGELLSTVTNQQKALSTAVDTYQSTVSEAFSAASANCATKPNDTMPTLRASIQSARTTLTNLETSLKNTSEIKQLITTRDSAIKDDNGVFAKSIATYTSTLTSALQSTNN